MPILLPSIEEIIRKLQAGEPLPSNVALFSSFEKLEANLPPLLSAFSNGPGGIVVFGLSQENGFKPEAGFNAEEALAKARRCLAAVSPQPAVSLEKFFVQDSELAVLRISEIRPEEKPCCMVKEGLYFGSYYPKKKGVALLTEYEVRRLLEARNPPRFDLEPVAEASLKDLKPEALKTIVEQFRNSSPRAFGKLDDKEVLAKAGIVAKQGKKFIPTLGGLLAAGIVPQQFFPGLSLSFSIYGRTKKEAEKLEEDKPVGLRGYVTRVIEGSIPEIILDALDLFRSQTWRSEIVDGRLETGLNEYPVEAFREGVANALMHRDYSPEGRCTPVCVKLFADCLEIVSPGGFFASFSSEDARSGIGSVRNSSLCRILEKTPYGESQEKGFVADSRGAGMQKIKKALKKNGNPPPLFENQVSTFSLSMLERPRKPQKKDVLDILPLRGFMSPAEIAEKTGLGRSSIAKKLKRLLKEGRIVQEFPGRQTPKQRYGLKSSHYWRSL